MVQKIIESNSADKKNWVQEMAEKANNEFKDGKLKEALKDYLVLKHYYSTYKEHEKEKAIAGKLIDTYVTISDGYLDYNSKLEKSSDDLVKKAVYNLMDAVDISQKYGFDIITDKIYRNAVRICRVHGMMKLGEEIENMQIRHIEKTCGNKKNLYF